MTVAEHGTTSMLSWPRVLLAGLPVDLVTAAQAVRVVESYAAGHQERPLGLVSANIDHIHHFGPDRSWLGRPGSAGRHVQPEYARRGDVDWLTLLDGAPLVSKAYGLTGQIWPKLSGSDLIHPLLELAARKGFRVGFVGGTAETHDLLRPALAERYSGLSLGGCWAPERSLLEDPIANRDLVAEIKAARVDILVVGLGKPRQERWIAENAAASGAGVLLAFGAVVDFLAGRIQRAPQWIVDQHGEWLWRLALEPRRLSRRYLLQGPGAYRNLRAKSRRALPAPAINLGAAQVAPSPNGVRDFIGGSGRADVTAVIVTYNSARHIDDLIDDLRSEAGDLRIRVVVVDSGSTDDTTAIVLGHTDITLINAGSNVGYAAGINLATPHLSYTGAVLILNPDLRIQQGAVGIMLRRLKSAIGIGAVVPKILDQDGRTYYSLRREPSIRRAIGDALFGDHLPARPAWSSETERSPGRYGRPHPVDWATGAALMIDSVVYRRVGPWNESFFLYSEETDFFRRLREYAVEVWFEPDALVVHERGGSGSSPELSALLSVNRIKYAELHHGRMIGAGFRGAVTLGEALRSYKPVNRYVLRTVLDRRRWAGLPHAEPRLAASSRPPSERHSAAGAGGSIIIPAHNEAAVIRRTLAPLSSAAASGMFEVIVVCNGCLDNTAEIARAVPGIKVLEIDTPSKINALNLGDATATRWPRLYLDADIVSTQTAVSAVFDTLTAGDWLAARPSSRYETVGADRLVRSYYRARGRITHFHQVLWGGGAYALSEAGHKLFQQFPDVVGDDLFIDRLFDDAEKLVVPTEPVVVQTPRRSRDLLTVLRRTYRGNAEYVSVADHASGTAPSTEAKSEPATGLRSTPQLPVPRISAESSAGTLSSLARSISGPRSLADAVVYTGFAVAGRIAAARSGSVDWERDDSTRGDSASEGPST